MANRPERPLLHNIMKRAADNLVPLQASMELTYRCNLACKHCYIDTREDELSLAEYKDIIDQLADAGTMYLMFTGGEPLVRDDFFDIAFYARDRGFILLMLTNGTLITPEIAENIRRLEPLNVGMSLHGANPATHDSITGNNGSFNLMTNSVRLLKNLGVSVSLQTLLMDENVNEAAEMRELAKQLGVCLRIGNEFVPARSGSLSSYKYTANSDDLYNSYTSGLLEIDAADNCEVKGPCQAGKGICSISPDGTVYPCLLMPMKIGNLRESSFNEIWKINPAEELTHLRSITEEDFIRCKGCELYKYCYRCTGVAYSETGTLTEPAPSTCRNAALKYEFLNRKGVVV